MESYFLRNLYMLCNSYSNTNSLLLLCDIQNQLYHDGDNNDLCLIFLNIEIFSDTDRRFTITGYSYKTLSENPIIKEGDSFRISGSIFPYSYLTYLLEYRYDFVKSLFDKKIDNIISIENNNRISENKRKNGVVLLNYLIEYLEYSNNIRLGDLAVINIEDNNSYHCSKEPKLASDFYTSLNFFNYSINSKNTTIYAKPIKPLSYEKYFTISKE